MNEKLNEKVNNLQTRIIRGRILKILKTNYPYPTGSELISDILTDNQYKISPPQVQAQLIYLKEKEYIEIVENDIDGINLTSTMAKITTKGIDLLEGAIKKDPGVRLV